jgi:hypothetical protein
MKQFGGEVVPTCVSDREANGSYDDGATGGTGSGGRRGEAEGSGGTGGYDETGGYGETGGTGGYGETGGTGGTGGYGETGGTGGYGGSGSAAATGGSAGTAGGSSGGGGTGCALVSYEGVCLGDVLTYCGTNGPVIVDCAAYNMVCAYDPQKSYFDCVLPPTTAGCGNVTFEGECSGGTLKYCENGTVYTADCTATGSMCGWNNAESLYDCL